MKPAEPMLERRMVRFHPPVGLSTLFRPLPKVKPGMRSTLDITYQPSKEGPALRFSAREALGIPEQTLLLVLVELAQEQFATHAEAVVLSARTENEFGKRLWSSLNRNNIEATGETVCVVTTWYELSRRCNSKLGGSGHNQRKAELRRLCEVIVWECHQDKKNTTGQSTLVSWIVGNDDHVHLALNCRVASAILGQPYAQISLSERLSLKRDVSMAVHAFLSTTLRQGHHLKIGVDKLMNRLWPDDAERSPTSTQRRRSLDVRAGLNELDQLEGWTVTWERSGMAVVMRKKVGGVERPGYGRIANKSMAYREQLTSKVSNKIIELRTFDASGLFLNIEKRA